MLQGLGLGQFATPSFLHALSKLALGRCSSSAAACAPCGMSACLLCEYMQGFQALHACVDGGWVGEVGMCSCDQLMCCMNVMREESNGGLLPSQSGQNMAQYQPGSDRV